MNFAIPNILVGMTYSYLPHRASYLPNNLRVCFFNFMSFCALLPPFFDNSLSSDFVKTGLHSHTSTLLETSLKVIDGDLFCLWWPMIICMFPNVQLQRGWSFYTQLNIVLKAPFWAPFHIAWTTADNIECLNDVLTVVKCTDEDLTCVADAAACGSGTLMQHWSCDSGVCCDQNGR